MHRSIKQTVNKQAHVIAHKHYAEARADLVLEAERLLAQGRSPEQVIAALCAWRARARD